MGKVKTAKRVDCHRFKTEAEIELQKSLITETKILSNLRKNYMRVLDHILGEDYYNMACDVYTCDDFCADDLIKAYDEQVNKTHYSELVLGFLGGCIFSCLVITIMCSIT